MSTPTLHAYQRVAVRWLQSTPRAGLFLDMGLGKTAIALSALTPAHLPALVVAPKRVAEHVWPVEAALWRPELTVALAAGKPAARAAALAAGADLTVVAVEHLAQALAAGVPYRTVIADESSMYKDHRSQRTKTLCALTAGPSVQNTWLLTGTPTPNGLMDLWSQILILDGGKRLGSKITHFRERYFRVGTFASGRPAVLANGAVAAWEPLPTAPEAIHRAVEDITLSMSAVGRLDLPPVTHNNVRVSLPPRARAAYDTLRKDLAATVDTVLGPATFSAANAAVLSDRLSQVTAGFLYDHDALGLPLGTATELHRAKIDAVREIVDGTTSPVLVLYRYRQELAYLQEEFPDLATMDTPDVVARWNRGELPVLAIHPASAGHGLNLQHGGHVAVWTTPTWSLEHWDQANARLARQGQTHPVVIHCIVAADTIDSRILAALSGKTSVQAALLEHVRSPV